MSQEPIEVTAGEAAQEFVAQEIRDLRTGLQRLQIAGTIAVVALAVFLGGIAQGFASNLEPKEASVIARGYISQQMETGQTQLSDYLRTEIPAQIEQAPEYALAQLPEMRENLENELEAKLQEAAKETSESLSIQLDSYMEENKDEFKTIILAGQDKDTTDAVAQQTKNMFIAYLNSSSDSDESIQEKFDKALVALDEVDQKTTRLANATDLTDTEKKTKRALAVMFGAVNEAKANTVLPTKEDIQGALKNIIPVQPESAPAESSAPVAQTSGAKPVGAKSLPSRAEAPGSSHSGSRPAPVASFGPTQRPANTRGPAYAQPAHPPTASGK